MSWQILAGLSVLLFSINGLLHRVLMKDAKSDPFAQAVAFSGMVGIFGLIIITIRGGFTSTLTATNLPMFVLIAVVTTIGSIFAFKGFKFIEASEHTILLTSSKFGSTIGAVVILGEALTANKLIGGILVIAGVLAAEWRRHQFVFNKGAVYVLISALSYAVGEILSFYVLRDFDGTCFLVYSCILIATIILIIKPSTIYKLSFYARPKNLTNILIVSFNDALASLLVFSAYQLGRNALQIGPLMATQTIITVILAYIFLREYDRLPQKLLGAALAVAGAMIVI